MNNKTNNKYRDRKEYHHQYYIEHKEHLRKIQKDNYMANIDTRRANALAYYHEHKEEISRKRKESRDVKKNELHDILQK